MKKISKIIKGIREKEGTKKIFSLIDSLALIYIGLLGLLAMFGGFFALWKYGITTEGNFLLIMGMIFTNAYSQMYKDYKKKKELGTTGDGQ